MGKQNQGTKFLYRKSNCTINTRSKTCSGASQLLTRSGILQLKKKLPKTNYYIENGKVKRDLSIETDKCILRGYYKRKFGRFKRSINTTEVGTFGVKHDYNSCGDNIPEEHNNKTRLNIDVTSLVVENLKDLLNDWIKKYLLNNNETKQKIETVLDSILHKLELQRNSSSCTYTLDIKVDEKSNLNLNKTETAKYETREKQSCQTVPVTGKHIKLISTLSIPRNIKRYVISTKSQYLKRATRKIRYKNVFLTVSRSSTFLLNSSSVNLLSISTKSFTKRCATYDSTEIKTNKKHEVVLLPKSSYSDSIPETVYRERVKFDLESEVCPNPLEIEPVQSLVKSIYADDPANITSTDRNECTECKHDNYTMTDTDCTFKIVTPPTQCHNLNWKKVTPESDTLKVRNKRRKNCRSKTLTHEYKTKKTKSNKKHPRSYKCLSKINTESSNFDRKIKAIQDKNSLLKDIQVVLKFITEYTNSKNVKFDVKINVSPELQNKMQDDANDEKNKKHTPRDGNFTAAYNVISTQILPETQTGNLVTENHIISSNSSQQSQPKLISILDGALSQSKYVISKEPSNETTDKNVKLDIGTTELKKTRTELEIAKDISELRLIIKDLALTTEKFVKEHLKHLNSKSHDMKGSFKEKGNKIDNNTSKELNIQRSTVSKAVQYANDKNQITSGLKLKKEPKKKDLQELNTNLGKKSISYNIIESESILKVTDMTSIAADLNTDIFIHKALNCSLPKSKSQFEITIGHSKKKLLAYYCDELIKSRRFIQNRNTCCTCSSNTYKYATCPHAENDSCLSINEKKCQEDCENALHSPPRNEEDCEISDPVYSCSSVYMDVEDRKKFAIRSRNGMSFWEGLLYCILLWIPVVVIFWLIYVYVIRDIIQPKNPAIGRTMISSQRLSNNSLFHITLSDLGF